VPAPASLRQVGDAPPPSIGDDFQDLRLLRPSKKLMTFARKTERKPSFMVTILQVVPRLDAGGAYWATIEIVQALYVLANAPGSHAGGRRTMRWARPGGEIVTLRWRANAFTYSPISPHHQADQGTHNVDWCTREAARGLEARSCGAAHGKPFVTPPITESMARSALQGPPKPVSWRRAPAFPPIPDTPSP